MGEARPGAHATQPPPESAVPAGQLEAHIIAPTGEKEPAAHAVQALAPVAAWYWPEAQVEQAEAPRSGAKVPAAQAVQTAVAW